MEKSHELTKVKVANRPEQSRESSRTKSRIVQNESRELTKKSIRPWCEFVKSRIVQTPDRTRTRHLQFYFPCAKDIIPLGEESDMTQPVNR